jgi:hypothetical protein
MALGLTQPLVKMSTRNIPGGKGGPCVRLTSPPSRAECHEIWEPKPHVTLWATLGLLRDSFTFTRCRLRSSKVKRYARKRLRRLTMTFGNTAEIFEQLCDRLTRPNVLGKSVA